MKKNTIFITAALIVTAYLITFAFTHPMYILDCIFAYLVIIIFFFIEKKHPIKPWLIILGCIPFIIELSGLAFGFFAFELFGFGFDKMLHFGNSFMITLLLYFWISTKHKKNDLIKILIAIFVVIGFGSIGEILEFLGQRYFQIYSPGMFSMGDLLPSTLKNDLINYDTWWDMILNVLGASTAGIILMIKKYYKN
ncbi:MAG: hypothetical protein ACP5NV_00805 [Candidatus Woesearchaeota archaeon]